jgi:hypothetical protein
LAAKSADWRQVIGGLTLLGGCWPMQWTIGIIEVLHCNHSLTLIDGRRVDPSRKVTRKPMKQNGFFSYTCCSNSREMDHSKGHQKSSCCSSLLVRVLGRVADLLQCTIEERWMLSKVDCKKSRLEDQLQQQRGKQCQHKYLSRHAAPTEVPVVK